MANLPANSAVYRVTAKLHGLSARKKTAYRGLFARWRRNAWLAAGFIGLFANAGFLLAETTDSLVLQRQGSGNPILGKQKISSERCQECHGEDGISIDQKIPHHAGQYAQYLIKQLRNFQSGERKHETMSIMAADLTAEDMADIAAYYALQKPMRGSGVRDNPVAQQLINKGDPARQVPACIACHGENGKGAIKDGVVYPLIGGQRKVYLIGQLQSWRLADRTNSPDGVMNKIAKLLSDDEIEALADYLSEL